MTVATVNFEESSTVRVPLEVGFKIDDSRSDRRLEKLKNLRKPVLLLYAIPRRRTREIRCDVRGAGRKSFQLFAVVRRISFSSLFLFVSYILFISFKKKSFRGKATFRGKESTVKSLKLLKVLKTSTRFYRSLQFRVDEKSVCASTPGKLVEF